MRFSWVLGLALPLSSIECLVAGGNSRMKLIAKWGVLLLLLPSALAALLVLSIDEAALLNRRADLTPERIAQGKRVFDRNDPRRLKSGEITRVRLEERDLDLAINYAANQVFDGVAGLTIANGRAQIQATLKLPDILLGRFLNMKLELCQSEALPGIDHMTLGKLWIPGFLAEYLLRAGARAFFPMVDWQALVSMIKHVTFESKQVGLVYQWHDDLPGKLTGALWSASDQKRLEMYQGRLAELTRVRIRRLQLLSLMRPLFRLASERSVHGDAIAENRALILVLAFYVNQKDLSKLMPLAKTWPRPSWRSVLLNGRDDLTKHYLVSAMLAAYAGTPLADAVGLYKEIEDARSGSGFSFNDIAADRAGRRMGELAVSSESVAKAIQARLGMSKESDFMPATDDLPEFMTELEFKRRFGGLQGAEYRQMMGDIDRRIAVLPINQEKAFGP